MARPGPQLVAALLGGGKPADRLLLLNTLGDLITLLAALAATIALFHLWFRRRDAEFRPLFLFAACASLTLAAAHGTALWGLVRPDRWPSAWSGLAAGTVAFAVAIIFWMQVPDMVRLPSGRQLRRSNAALTRELQELNTTAQLRTQEAHQLAMAFASATQGLALLTPEGHWQRINPALPRLLGTTEEALRRLAPRELLGAVLMETTEEATEERDTITEGQSRRLRWRATPLCDAEGTPRARLVQCHLVNKEEDTDSRQALTDQKRRADEAVALLQHALAEREKSEAQLARRAEQLERDATRLERLAARVAELTGSDPKTGLLASQAIARRLELSVAMAKRYGEGFAVLIVAADPVDDLRADDKTLLGALGEVLRAELRETDAAARLDEERICVLLPRTNAGDAARVAERIRRRLSATPLVIPDGRTLRLSCCVGSAEWAGGQGLGELLGAAAEALRNARASGRNSVASR